MVTIKEVSSKQEEKVFIQFANKLYKDCPYYCPSLDADERGTFSQKNPAMEHSVFVRYLAYKDGKCVGRIAGMINYKANEHWKHDHVRFGWFDFIDDMEVSKALLDAVAAWGKSKGMKELNGPVGFTDFDKEGLMIDGYEHLAPMIVLYNHPYYVKHVEAYGLTKEADWNEYRLFVDQVDELPERVTRGAKIVMDRYKLHTVKVSGPRELKKRFGLTYFDVISDAYSILYNYQPLTQKQKEYISDMYFPLLNFDFVCLVCNEQEEIVGLGVGMPDLAPEMVAAGGSLFPFAWIKLLKKLRAKQFDTYLCLLIAARPDYQDKGIPSVIFAEQFPVFKKYGVKLMETGSILESNYKNLANFLVYPHEEHRHRRAYIKEI